MESHARCRSDTKQSKKSAARLIEINFTNHTPTLRVIETSGQLREEMDYMTLSYCWGDAMFPTLRIDNEQQLGNGITYETLPKVFQDAIHIAGWFQVKYLWIDALCILQDSHDDWIKESCKMKDIYRNSLLTVAATAATDPFRGCFRDRNPRLAAPIRYRKSLETQEYQTIFSRHDWEWAMDSSPLSKRAWAFQERLLSPRVLHFGENQMLWECNELCACESCPGGIQSNVKMKSSIAAKGQLVNWNEDSMSGHKDFIHKIWRPIVNSYSKGALTKFTDKCTAISGIAEEAQSLCGGTYMAGLWRENFEAQLLWYTLPSRNDVPTAASHKRTTTYVAPSWSWLSVDGPIGFFRKKIPSLKFDVLLEIVGIEVERSSDNRFGTIKGGRIQARGWLSPGTWEVLRESMLDCAYHGELRSIRGHPCHRENRVKMDTAVGTGEVVCLPVGSDTIDHKKRKIYGLVLAKTDATADEYRRIGTFDIHEYSQRQYGTEARRQLFQQKLENGKWIDGPKTTFTIV